MNKDTVPVSVLANEPAYAIARRLPVRSLLRREKQCERRFPQKAGPQKRRAEAHEILGRRKISTASPFVAVVHGWGDHEFPLRVAFVELGALGVSHVLSIGVRVRQPKRL